VKLAEAYGAAGLRAKESSEVEGIIKEALTIKGPVVVDFVVNPTENVYPMVPSGGAINEMIFDDPVKAKETTSKKGKTGESIQTA
jgi:acetolactate synthase-1/2/3 large subunit